MNANQYSSISESHKQVEQLSLFDDFSDNSEESSADELPVSPHFSLPIVMYTHEFLRMCVENKLGLIPMLLALTILGNMDTHRGFIHKFKVKDKAKYLECSEARIHQSLHILRGLGFANLKLRHGTVSGRIRIKSMLPGRVLTEYEKFNLRKESESFDMNEDFDCGGHSMPVGMLHHSQLETHIAGGTTAGHLRLMLACCLNVNVQTGKLHEKRPCEWAELCGLHRTWVVEGFDHCNEIGVIQTRTEYDVIGRLPFVSLSNGYFRMAELAREEGRDDSKDRLTEKLVALYEGFGLQLKGLAHEMIENAWRLLGEDADKIRRRARQKMKELLGREPAGDFTRRRIAEGADSKRIPYGKTLSFDEALGPIPFA